MGRQVSNVWWILALVAALLIGVGVTYMRNQPAPVQGPVGARIASKAELNPDALFSPKAELIYTGWNLSVNMLRKIQNDRVRFEFLSHGTVLGAETEVYSVNSEAFGLIEMNMERYAPAIPLLKFPMNVGDVWEWKGNQESGGRQHKCWATITSKVEKMPERGIEAVHVSVDLSVESGAGNPSTRKIDFWFTKGRGIIKRTYGEAIARVSLDSEEASE